MAMHYVDTKFIEELEARAELAETVLAGARQSLRSAGAAGFAMREDLTAALAHAEAAEKQLAEAQEEHAKSTEFWIDKTEKAGWELEQAQGRIAELERLVPDADMLRQVTECADRSGAGKYDARLADSINKMLPLIPAIRKYKECDNDTNGR